MGPNTRVYDKFTGYSVADCDCAYCLHWFGKQCVLPVCCCLEEKEAAYQREHGSQPEPVSP